MQFMTTSPGGLYRGDGERRLVALHEPLLDVGQVGAE
jgi:hypothetical protein